MNNYQQSNIRLSSPYYIYTSIKLTVLLITIIKSPSCSSALLIYSILYSMLEAYELLTFILEILFVRGLIRHHYYFILSIAKVTNEFFRMIIIIAITSALLANQKCVSSDQGTLMIAILSLGYLKYSLGICAICGFCIYFRSSINQNVVDVASRKRIAKSILKKYRKTLTKDKVCPICMDCNEDEGVILECGHCFHAKCLKDWIFIKDSCPVCRKNLF